MIDKLRLLCLLCCINLFISWQSFATHKSPNYHRELINKAILKTAAVSPPTVSSPIYYCQNSTADPLTAIPSAGNTLIWYGANAAGGTPSFTAPTPSTASVGSTTYYVSETDGVSESTRSSITVFVVASNNSQILSFRCDPTQIAAADQDKSVYFDWTNTSGLPNQYTYSYTVDGGAPVTGTTGLSHLQVFGLSPGKSATLTLWHTTYPCDRSVLTCTVPCGALTTTPTFNQISAVCEGSTAPSLPSTSIEGVTGTWSPATIDSNFTGTVVHTFTPDPVAFPCANSQTMSVTVEAKSTPIFSSIPATVCQFSAAPTLPLNSDNTTAVSGSWSPNSVDTSVLGPVTYTFIPDAGQCVVSAFTTVTIDVIPTSTPDFDPIAPICSGETAPLLNNTSPNGITGTWSPAVIDNLNSASYTFTPDGSQCANNQVLVVTVLSKTVPNFAAVIPFCSGAVAPVLLNTSPNGVSGIWSPATIDNTASGVYVFTPNANECAVPQSLNVMVLDPVSPGFNSFKVCSGSVPPDLELVSPFGITGVWSPATVDTMVSASYLFTPDPGQCAGPQSIDVTVLPSNSLVDFQWTVSQAFEDSQSISIVADAPGGDYLYQLDGGEFQESSVFDNVSSGMHSVTVIEQNGCSNPITKTDIVVVNYPRYFTPNNDGYNDEWNIFDLSDQASSKVHVFDRYGKLLKEIRPGGSGWNGTYGGRPLPADDYWFVVYYNEDDLNKEFRSHFSLIR